jgi:predicted Fe-Mo cluster-binding NifX family protein
MTEVVTSKIAVPLAGEDFSMHFGQSTAFAVFVVDGPQRKIISSVILPLPGQHACGMIGWMIEHGVQTVIVGGLGRGALANLEAARVNVYAGIPGTAPAVLVQACLDGQLQLATATCPGHAHGEHSHHHGHNHEGSGCGSQRH